MPTLEGVKKNLTKLREIAREEYAKHGASQPPDSWGLPEYLGCIDGLETAIERALLLPECTRRRFEAEKHARNQIAQRLYYRGRIDLKTGALGVFHTKRGDKGVHWDATPLSRAADRLAAEPLRQVYKQTEACMQPEV